MKRRDVLRMGAAAPVAGTLAQELAKSADWKPAVLSPDQNETVISLTEAIIPATDTAGAKEAKVNRFIDLFLKDARGGDRDRFLEGLSWFEDFVIKQHGKSFAKLSASSQSAVLMALEKGGPDVEAGHRFFRLAKQLTSRIYYSTEIGFKEMNKGGRVPRSYGCSHPRRHA